MKNKIVEAVRERMRMAGGWSKSTGYPPADYFDTMMDLRRILAAWDRRADDAGRLREALKFAEGGCSIEPTDERIERILATALRQSQALVKEMAEALKVADHALEVAGFQDIQPIRACVRAALLSAGKEVR